MMNNKITNMTLDKVVKITKYRSLKNDSEDNRNKYNISMIAGWRVVKCTSGYLVVNINNGLGFTVEDIEIELGIILVTTYHAHQPSVSLHDKMITFVTNTGDVFKCVIDVDVADKFIFTQRFLLNIMCESYIYEFKCPKKSSVRQEIRKVLGPMIDDKFVKGLNSNPDIYEALIECHKYANDVITHLDKDTKSLIEYRTQLASSDVLSGFIKIDKLYKTAEDEEDIYNEFAQEDEPNNSSQITEINIWLGTIIGARSVGKEQRDYVVSKKKHVLNMIKSIFKNHPSTAKLESEFCLKNVTIMLNGDIHAKYIRKEDN